MPVSLFMVMHVHCERPISLPEVVTFKPKRSCISYVMTVYLTMSLTYSPLPSVSPRATAPEESEEGARQVSMVPPEVDEITAEHCPHVKVSSSPEPQRYTVHQTLWTVAARSKGSLS